MLRSRAEAARSLKIHAIAGRGGAPMSRGIRRRRTRAGRRRKPSHRRSAAKAAGFTDDSVGRTGQDANKAGAFVAELRTMGW
jgi:hypothetical protein